MSAANLAQLLAQWVREAGISKQDEYEEAVWNKTKEVMAEFVNYMDDDNIIPYASNCDNAGWNLPGRPGDGDIYFGQTVGDKIVCVLMVGALFFMNGWTSTEMTRLKEDKISERIREHLRCIIVHMFSAVLDAYVCPSGRGTSYAWRQMEGMHSGPGSWGGGSIERGKCGRELVAHGKMRTLDLNAEVKKWLGGNSKLQKRLKNVKGTAACRTQWQQKWKIEEFLNNENMQNQENLEITREVHDLREGMKDILKELAREVEQGEEERLRAKKRKLGETGEVWAEGNKLERRRQHKHTHDNYRQCRTKDGQNGQASTKARTPSSKEAPAKDSKSKAASDGNGDKTKKTEEPPPKKPEDPPAKVPEAPKEVVPEKKVPKAPVSGGDSVSRADPTAGGQDGVATVSGQQPQAPAPPVLPASPPAPQPPPAAPTTEAGVGRAGAAAGADGNSTEPTVKVSDAKSPGKAPCPDSNGTSTGVSISCETTSDAALGETPEVKKLLEEEDKNKAGADRRKSNSVPEPPAAAEAAPAESTPAPATPVPAGTPAVSTEVTAITTASTENPPPTGVHTTVTGTGAGTGATVTTASTGADDPPPLNPPKPTANPNPNQSGSSGSGAGGRGTGTAQGAGSGGAGAEPSAGSAHAGSGSTGHQTPGSSGPGATGTVKPNSSGTGSTGHGTATTGGDGGGWALNLKLPKPNGNFGGSYGTGPTPDPHGTSSSTPKEGGTLAPDLTADVFTATTPVLFFLSAVAVALLGYSLWKLRIHYFAYLGTKRRRKYRTVRDVPSPPLDEQILDHLQRGERPPPPDYGYTVVRDRPPALTSARARPPRVHKRTIIELHLEMLNECEVAAWENVKDDYLHILVEAFMGDRNGHSGSPASSSNHDSPGTNVASTLHPSTDIDGIDPCSPHDCDSCSCMETIQLATDRSAPNAADPDPCSCMETIQFATDTSPPTEDDPDPWRCMETIPLATDPCPPNEDNPDPWSCMDNIQLQLDPCSPNDQDPWSCMQSIQLDAEQSRAHSDPGDATLDCIHWINWIDHHKHLLHECMTQPWFMQLKAHWKQYYQQHATNEVSGNSEHCEHGHIPSADMTKLRL
ncbi:hypothetical protein AK88_04940 [Plasmodium fragile]|uniref:Schizont-infected cell agglutination C-terminal domain-containing protein n=1 Tax=Plasmodium fragile TaxID=5857 RepID=A0A0D9QF29_PLAFR|nr:uncharacterized protein AK88_04940 [Plasmodium fragile]KJP85437.1 hypothetical protein AK88_04940 [Plasmodium fragile]